LGGPGRIWSIGILQAVAQCLVLQRRSGLAVMGKSAAGIASTFLRRPGFSDIESSIDLANPGSSWVIAAATKRKSA
jgi:hypothetical protein